MKGKAVMKAAKAAKAMKAMKKVKKASIVAKGKLAKVAVFRGKKVKTVGGLSKDSLTKSKSGKIVSKKASARGKKMFAQSALREGQGHPRQVRSLSSSTHVCLLPSRSFSE